MKKVYWVWNGIFLVFLNDKKRKRGHCIFHRNFLLGSLFFSHTGFLVVLGSLCPDQSWEVVYIKQEGRVERKSKLSERLDTGLIYISSSLPAWDSHILVPTVAGSKNYCLWLSQFPCMFPYGQSYVIGHIGFSNNLKDKEIFHCYTVQLCDKGQLSLSQ